MNAEQRYQVARVQKALEWVRKHFAHGFHFTIVADPVEELGDEYILAISRTSRGAEDPNHYKIYVHTENVGEQTMQELRSSALHEILHAYGWGMYELISTRKQEQAKLAFEGFVYPIERAFARLLKLTK